MLEPHETSLINGHRLKKIGNEFVIFDESGMQVGLPTKSETLAIIRLVDQRVSYAQDRHSESVIAAASRYMNAQAWLKHLELGEVDPDEDAIERAKCGLASEQVNLDHALALAGDKSAIKRLADSEGDQQHAA